MHITLDYLFEKRFKLLIIEYLFLKWKHFQTCNDVQKILKNKTWEILNRKVNYDDCCFDSSVACNRYI